MKITTQGAEGRKKRIILAVEKNNQWGLSRIHIKRQEALFTSDQEIEMNNGWSICN